MIEDFYNILNNFECNNSTIIAKNLDIGFKNSTNFLSDQTVKNDQTATIINKITQTVCQTATATVEGMGGFIIGLLLIAAVFIYGLGAPLSTPAGKIAICGCLCLGIVVIILLQYLHSTPPFFSRPKLCINNSAMGIGSHECSIDGTVSEIQLDSPPLKYTFPLLPGGSPNTIGNLLQLAIAKGCGQSGLGMTENGGYTIKNMYYLQTILDKYKTYADALKIPRLPNLLVDPGQIITASDKPTTSDKPYYQIPDTYLQGSTGLCTPGICQVSLTSYSEPKKCPSDGQCIYSKFGATSNPSTAVANVNTNNWISYLNMSGTDSVSGANYAPAAAHYTDNDESIVRALFARFVLCDIVGYIDLHFWIHPKEYIKYVDGSDNNNTVVSQAGLLNDQTQIYKFVQNGNNTNLQNGFTGSGSIKGTGIGIIKDNTYKFQQFMRNIGGYILLGVIGFIILYMIFTHFTKYRKNKEQNVDGVKQ